MRVSNFIIPPSGIYSIRLHRLQPRCLPSHRGSQACGDCSCSSGYLWQHDAGWSTQTANSPCVRACQMSLGVNSSLCISTNNVRQYRLVKHWHAVPCMVSHHTRHHTWHYTWRYTWRYTWHGTARSHLAQRVVAYAYTRTWGSLLRSGSDAALGCGQMGSTTNGAAAKVMNLTEWGKRRALAPLGR